jgi:uncharacterized membrane protein YdjX (TVP38/TMEM64 family)
MDARTVSTIAIAVLLIVLIWDAYLTAQNSRDTISNVISSFNQQTGGLVALAIVALWIHWFLPLPQAWVSDDFTPPKA